MKINSIKDALELFEENAISHAQATEEGDYKKGNGNYKIIAAAKDYLESKNELSSLKRMLNHSSVGPRMWAASYLLPSRDLQAEKILIDIKSGEGIHALTAETTLNEWYSKKLKS